MLRQVALWAWDIVVDNCAICRNHIMDLCESVLHKKLAPVRMFVVPKCLGGFVCAQLQSNDRPLLTLRNCQALSARLTRRQRQAKSALLPGESFFLQREHKHMKHIMMRSTRNAMLGKAEHGGLALGVWTTVRWGQSFRGWDQQI